MSTGDGMGRGLVATVLVCVVLGGVGGVLLAPLLEGSDDGEEAPVRVANVLVRAAVAQEQFAAEHAGRYAREPEPLASFGLGIPGDIEVTIPFVHDSRARFTRSYCIEARSEGDGIWHYDDNQGIEAGACRPFWI